MISDFSVARSRYPLHGKYVATGCRRHCRRLHSPRNCVNCADSSDKLPQTTATMTYTYGVGCVRVCGQAWMGLKSASDSREMPSKLQNVCPELPFVFDLCVCPCVCVLSRSVAHITNLYGQKMAFRGGHTASLLHNRYTHKQQIQVHKRRSGRGGQRRSGQCNTPTHLAQDNSALSSVQAQTQANKKNNNSNNDITAPNKMAGTGFVWGSSSSFCSSYFCSFSFCCWSWQIHLGFGLSCSWR